MLETSPSSNGKTTFADVCHLRVPFAEKFTHPKGKSTRRRIVQMIRRISAEPKDVGVKDVDILINRFQKLYSMSDIPPPELQHLEWASEGRRPIEKHLSPEELDEARRSMQQYNTHSLMRRQYEQVLLQREYEERWEQLEAQLSVG